MSFPVHEASPTLDRLTPAEAAVAQLAMRGLSNADIARARGSRPSTVANQLRSVFEKVAVGSRRELVARYAASAK